MKKAILYKKLDNNNVKCTACNHFCNIAPNKTGICGVRKNIKGDLYLLVYELTSGTEVDKIEKKPFFHFLPNSDAFSIGTIGCNFSCSFCQNAWMSQPLKDKSIPVPPLYKLPIDEIINYCTTNNIPVIAYTFNEPATYFEYSYDTAKLAHKKGIKNVWVSNGYASKESIDKISPYLDAINIDLKAFTEKFYRDICKTKLAPVLDNIKYYYKKGVWVELTTLIIPGENDSEKELKQIAEFIASVSKSIPWHISRFSPAYKMKNKSQTPEETIKKAYDIGKKVGLKYIYGGNIWGEDIQSIYCPKCNSVLIRRDWTYSIVEGLDHGKCRKCGTKIDGIWE